MKKILFILHYPPPVHGAAMVGQYIKDSQVINEVFDCRYINLGTSANVDEIGKGGWTKWKRFFGILWETLKSLNGFGPDLVYLTLTSSGIGFYKDFFIAILAKLYGKKVVYHFHNKGIHRRQHKWFDNLLYKIVFRRSEVILLSKALFVDVQKYVPRERVHFCANGIPEDQGIPPHIQGKDKVEILFLSNLIASKGVFILLRACQLLKKRGLSFTCTFVGGEGDLTAAQFANEVEKLGLKEKVHYAGRKYGGDKQKAYLSADIFVLPTYYHNECFPLVLLEAMQYSLPVISTYEGGIPSIVDEGRTGFLITQKDVEKLAEKLECLLLDTKLRQRMGANGHLRYQQEFTLDIFVKRLTAILQTIVRS